MAAAIDLNRIRLFIKIIEAGNISRAANLLNEPKAKLSRNLALLEQELGIQLAYRTTRQFRLTEAGQQFYESARQNIDGLMNAVSGLREHGEEVSGSITLTAPDDIGVFVVTDLVSEFKQIHPKVQFNLIYSFEMLDLVKLGVDVAIRIGHLKDSSMVQRKVGHVRMILAAAPRYLDRFKSITHLEQLSQHATVGFGSGQWELYSGGSKKTLKLKHAIITNNYLAARDFVKSGHGIGYLPNFLCEEALARGEMVQILKSWGDQGTPVQVVVPQHKNLPRRVRVFFDFAAKKINERF